MADVLAWLRDVHGDVVDELGPTPEGEDDPPPLARVRVERAVLARLWPWDVETQPRELLLFAWGWRDRPGYDWEWKPAARVANFDDL